MRRTIRVRSICTFAWLVQFPIPKHGELPVREVEWTDSDDERVLDNEDKGKEEEEKEEEEG